MTIRSKNKSRNKSKRRMERQLKNRKNFNKLVEEFKELKAMLREKLN